MTLPVLFTAGTGAYNIQRSLRFRSSASAYLSRTPASAGNQKTWTWSAWVKPARFASQQPLFNSYSSATNYGLISFSANAFYNANDTLKFNVVVSNSNQLLFETSAVYRDPSAWYHIVIALDTTQATNTNRVKIYVNGVQVTAFITATYPTQNLDVGFFNTTNQHQIGSLATGTYGYFDGYMTEINFIDGQALTPSSFGQTNSATGVWQPIKYSGTYGTNGFYLNFSDNSNNTATTIGKDYSGNGNNWTPNNISVTSGATYDSMTDVPTLTSPTAANYSTLNPLMKFGSNMSWNNGNLQLVKSSSSTQDHTYGTLGVSSGKWYWEMTVTALSSPGTPYIYFGIARGLNLTTSYDDTAIWYASDGTKSNRPASSFNQAYGATYTTGDVIAVALDLDAGTITFYKNNVSQGVAYSNLGSYPGLYMAYINFDGTSVTSTTDWNFGQQPFAYTPPTGFVALNTFNLPTPTIGATASSQANRYMDVLTWTGDGASSRAITGLNFQPDWVWDKMRSGAYQHAIVDSVRGGNQVLHSNSTSAEDTNWQYGYVSSFNSNGFTIQAGATSSENWNLNGSTFVAWNWKANGSGSTNTAGSITSTVSANTTAGFSIVTYTNQSSGVQTVGHGLGVAPKMIIVKLRSTTSNWFVYHASIGNTGGVFLDATSATNTNSAYWNNTSPTSSVFTIGTIWNSTATAVAYCFAEVAGYSAFGSYTGNGSSDGTFVFTGFRPRFVMVKRTDTSGFWSMKDTARDPYNVAGSLLFANASDAEYSNNQLFDLNSNGFKLRGSNNDINASGGTYIYMAFAENPFKYSLAR